MADSIHVLGFAGSLRKASYNRAALRAAAELLPPDTTLEITDLDGIPAFNEDHEQEPPPTVTALKAKIRAADAVLIATPEYNYSVPGVLKNALDWTSRPYGDTTWDGKPAAILSASVSRLGGVRAQYHLRQVFVYLNVQPINRPEVMIGEAQKCFDEAGRLTEGRTRELIGQQLAKLVEWARQLRSLQVNKPLR